MNLLFLVACEAPGSEPAVVEDAVDLRYTEDDAPAATEDLGVWWGPEATIDPGEDRMFCLFGTYTEADRGVHYLTTHQNAYGHHLQLMGTTASEIDYPDGSLLDCTATGSLNMADIRPIVLPNASVVGGVTPEISFEMPDGMAVEIEEGQRWVMQGHYINTGLDPIVVRDYAVMEYLDPEEVDTWAAPLVANYDDFEIPPGETAEATFDCTFGAQWDTLYLLGHMHEWGATFKLEEISGGVTTTILDVPDWQPEYRDAPPLVTYEPGEHPLAPTTTLRTTCSWFNDTDETLVFPNEMCVAVGVVYPQEVAAICDGGTIE